MRNSLQQNKKEKQEISTETWLECKAGSKQAREEIILNYYYLVEYIAGRVGGKLPKHLDKDDLVSYGVFGLFDAIEKFDPYRGIKFQTYAAQRIRGQIYDELRSMDWAPRSVRANVKTLDTTIANLESELLREPTDEEIAEEMDLELDEVRDLFRQSATSTMAALDQPISDVEDSPSFGATIVGDDDDDLTAMNRLCEQMAERIEDLPPREKIIFVLYYYEGCVVGDTLVHTETGVYRIADLLGEKVSVWNGSQWSEVTPFSTGNLPVYRVTLSDGSRVDATPGHEWLARTRTQELYRTLPTYELEVGMVLPEFELDRPDGKPIENAYSWGWMAGDGYMDNGRPTGLVQESEYAIIDIMGWKAYKEQINTPRRGVTATGSKFKRVTLADWVPREVAIELRDHTKGLPEQVMGMDSRSLSEFFAGWIDTDGSLIQQNNTDNFLLYGDEQKLRDAQVLLRRIGVNHAHISQFAEAGSATNVGTRNQDLWRLLIPSYESHLIPTKLKVAKRFGSRYTVNPAHPDGAKIDRARKQKIVSIEKISDSEETFCFDEPLNHQGVFGNVLTKQCTLAEVGRILGVTESRICQIHTAAVGELI